jgi:hypothetical protein
MAGEFIGTFEEFLPPRDRGGGDSRREREAFDLDQISCRVREILCNKE